MEKETSKKDILQLEKRVIDMELVAAEIKETAKDLSIIPEFKQRLDDVEDLVMVENAGFIELKGMLEKLVPPEIKLPENLEERLKTTEEKIKGLPDFIELETRIKSSIPTGSPELENRIKNLEAGVAQLNEKPVSTPDFSQTENKIRDSIITQLPDLIQLENRIKDSVSTIFPDLQKIKDDVTKKVEDIELKRQEIGKLADDIDERLKVSVKERVERELGRVRDDWLVYSERVNAVENFVKNFAKDVENIRPTLKKLDSFERILDLDKRTTEKLEEFSDITENLQKLAEKNTVIYSEIDKRTQALDVVEKELPSIQKNVSILTNELEKMKLEVVEKKDIAPLASNFRLIADDYKSLIEDLSKRTANLQIGLNKSLKGMELQTKELVKPLGAKIGELENNLSVIMNKETALEKRIDDTYKAVSSLTDSQVQTVNKKLGTLENRVKDIKIDDIRKLFDSIDSRIGNVEGRLKETKVGGMEKILDGISSKMIEFENKIGELEGKYGKIERFGERISEVRAPPTFFDEQVKNLISRIVFLESRLVAIEGSMEKASMSLPIIME